MSYDGEKSEMGRKGKNGGGGHQGGDDEHDHVIEFTPDGTFDINKLAKKFSKLMEDLHQPLIIHLPKISVEFEPGCTPREIVDGYNQAMKAQMVVKPSNSNVKGSKKK